MSQVETHTPFETVIGLEIHVQLLTESKIFCACSTRFGAAPNANTCPVCLGMPGVLPVLNRRVVELALKLALALDCTVHPESVFARKNYFYPDLAKGYQISQYKLPLGTGGQVTFPLDGGACVVPLNRIHLEEDAGKLIHGDAGASLVDFNRAGTPLVEVVSEPELGSPRAAYVYLQTLRQLVRWLGVSDGNMEEGSLRCDANVSLRPHGQVELGTKTELKNLNSFKNVERALDYEIARQTGVLAAGGVVVQETLLWDADALESRSMRSKEEAHDYRYFPDPDLPPLRLDAAIVDGVRRTLPELPAARAARYVATHSLPEYDASVLAGSRELGDYFEATLARVPAPKRVANWIMTEVMAVLNDRDLTIDALPVGPAALAELLAAVESGTISASSAKQVFHDMLDSGRSAGDIIDERGLKQIDDAAEIEAHVTSIVDDHPEQLAQYLAGKQSVIQFFMGQLMRRTRGQVNPARGIELLEAELESRRGAAD